MCAYTVKFTSLSCLLHLLVNCGIDPIIITGPLQCVHINFTFCFALLFFTPQQSESANDEGVEGEGEYVNLYTTSQANGDSTHHSVSNCVCGRGRHYVKLAWMGGTALLLPMSD